MNASLKKWSVSDAQRKLFRLKNRTGQETRSPSGKEGQDIDVDLDVLEMQILKRLQSRIQDLRIESIPGGLLLRGRTTTYYDKQLAEHALLELVESPNLINDIDIR